MRFIYMYSTVIFKKANWIELLFTVIFLGRKFELAKRDRNFRKYKKNQTLIFRKRPFLKLTCLISSKSSTSGFKTRTMFSSDWKLKMKIWRASFLVKKSLTLQFLNCAIASFKLAGSNAQAKKQMLNVMLRETAVRNSGS